MIIDRDYKNFSAAPEVNVDGFGAEEIARTLPLIKKFIGSYVENNLPDDVWLEKILSEHLPNKTPQEISVMAREISTAVDNFNTIRHEAEDARLNGLAPENFIAEKILSVAGGEDVQTFGDKLARLDAAIHDSNAALAETLTTKSGTINMNPNLDGLLAETEHANSFNHDAALKNSSVEARILHSTEKNSPDVELFDRTTGKVIAPQQMKFYSSVDEAAKAIERGEYSGQTLIVPTEHVGELKQRFPDKKISDRIEYDGVMSKPLTKADVKNLQEKIQRDGEIPTVSWTADDVQSLAVHLGKEIAFAGAAGAVVGAGVHVAKKILSGEEIRGDEVVDAALRTGADAGIKKATTAALSVAATKIPALAKFSAHIPNIACKAVDTIKILGNFLSGDISGKEAVGQLLWLAASSYVFELATGGLTAASLTGALTAALPVICSPVGIAVGAVAAIGIGIAAFGEKIFDAAESFCETVGGIVSDVWDGVTSVVEGIGSAVGSFFDWLLD